MTEQVKQSTKNKFIEWKNRFLIFRNKYLFTTLVFLIFALFLDDNDIFTLISQKQKLSKIKAEHGLVLEKLKETRKTLKKLHYTSEVERFAREEKLFKKDDEDIFIISYE